MDNSLEKQGIRLQKYLAQAGIASRRKAEEWIQSGRIKINGCVVTELGVRVTSKDKVEFDGQRVHQTEHLVYILLYKPTGVMTTTDDPQGRRTVMDLIDQKAARVYPVGRLDYDTSGLLLLTNDGQLANWLMHPRSGVTKHYEAVVQGRVLQEDILLLSQGVELDGIKTAPAIVKLLGTDGMTSRMLLILHEGRNRQVRRMLELIGHPCLDLTRTKYGPLTLRGLRPGQWRYLYDDEVLALQGYHELPVRIKRERSHRRR